MGYEGVEVFDLHGHDAAEVRGWLDELGLGGLRAAMRRSTRSRRDLPGLAAHSTDARHAGSSSAG